MTDQSASHCLRVSALSQTAQNPFDIAPNAARLGEIATTLDLLALKKVQFSGYIEADGKRDWRLEAKLGATVVQPCVVTLAPVTTRIETPVTRRFLARLPEEDVEDEEIEMPDDESIEKLQSFIDLEAVLSEALSLALPLYPRASDAALETDRFTEPGKAPMSDDDARPFAGLKALRDKLE
ncbi:DUF177 domain-containing protein [Rhodobacteraceae bacterium D3-12]|nr:DUF177 domain-containing protein [Rhodobacteraceae bacterium D3-12]